MLAMDGGTGMQAKETRYLGFLALDSMLFTYMLGQKAASLAKEREILKNFKDSALEIPLAIAS